MKTLKQYTKPETRAVIIGSHTILAGSYPEVSNDGGSINIGGEPETGDAGTARVRRYNVWDD